MKTNALTAQNCSLFEIDAELEAAFDQMQEEREITGDISDESRERKHPVVRRTRQENRSHRGIPANTAAQSQHRSRGSPAATTTPLVSRAAGQGCEGDADLLHSVPWTVATGRRTQHHSPANQLAGFTPDRRLELTPGVLSAYRKHPTSFVKRDAGVSSCRAERRIPAGHDQHPTQYPAGPGCSAAR